MYKRHTCFVRIPSARHYILVFLQRRAAKFIQLARQRTKYYCVTLFHSIILYPVSCVTHTMAEPYALAEGISRTLKMSTTCISFADTYKAWNSLMYDECGAQLRHIGIQILRACSCGLWQIRRSQATSGAPHIKNRSDKKDDFEN
jgi:hypothetical protein